MCGSSVADLSELASLPQEESPAAAAAAAATTYTVKAGDTLNKILKELLGDANAYMGIFNADRDQLSDPDKIKPGQVLKIPHPAK